MERTYSLDQIDEVAHAIVALIKENVITLTGEMGAGKNNPDQSLVQGLKLQRYRIESHLFPYKRIP